VPELETLLALAIQTDVGGPSSTTARPCSLQTRSPKFGPLIRVEQDNVRKG